METLKIPESILAELARMEEMANTGVPALPPPEFLAEFVRLQRGMRQWKQETLAYFAGVSRTTIERIERGETVSKESLDRVAIGLGYKVGDFTEPRVPLTKEEFSQKVEENLAIFAGTIQVPVRPLRTQPQAAMLARCHCYLLDSSRLDEIYQEDVANLRDCLDLTAFIIAQEGNVSANRKHPVRRRGLYADILKAVQHIERWAKAVALSGTYTAKTSLPLMPTVEIALIAFFPKREDPGAVKRKILLAPELIDLQTA